VHTTTTSSDDPHDVRPASPQISLALAVLVTLPGIPVRSMREEIDAPGDRSASMMRIDARRDRSASMMRTVSRPPAARPFGARVRAASSPAWLLPSPVPL